MKQIYIVAVSGGVDSVVLLHKLISKKPPLVEYIVAHFDHGIRSESAADVEFVSALAKRYGVAFESRRVELGANASEELARAARYAFLYETKKKYRAEAIITAHHQDDVIETMLLNMLRGSSPRGLIGFTRQGIVRPLMHMTKASITEYAKHHRLEWREDRTNDDERYLRNYVRKRLVPRMQGTEKQRLLDIREQLIPIYREIDHLSAGLLVQTMQKGALVRARFVVLPLPVAREVLAHWLRLERVSYDKKMLHRLVLAIKTTKPHKKIDINAHHYFYIDKGRIVLKDAGGHV